MTQHISVEQLKEKYPVIKVGSDEAGYIELDAEMYEKTINEWAENYPQEPKTKEELEAEAEARATQKAALLDRLGITEEEAKLLLA